MLSDQVFFNLKREIFSFIPADEIKNVTRVNKSFFNTINSKLVDNLLGDVHQGDKKAIHKIIYFIRLKILSIGSNLNADEENKCVNLISLIDELLGCYHVQKSRKSFIKLATLKVGLLIRTNEADNYHYEIINSRIYSLYSADGYLAILPLLQNENKIANFVIQSLNIIIQDSLSYYNYYAENEDIVFHWEMIGLVATPRQQTYALNILIDRIIIAAKERNNQYLHPKILALTGLLKNENILSQIKGDKLKAIFAVAPILTVDFIKTQGFFNIISNLGKKHPEYFNNANIISKTIRCIKYPYYRTIYFDILQLLSEVSPGQFKNNDVAAIYKLYRNNFNIADNEIGLIKILQHKTLNIFIKLSSNNDKAQEIINNLYQINILENDLSLLLINQDALHGINAYEITCRLMSTEYLGSSLKILNQINFSDNLPFNPVDIAFENLQNNITFSSALIILTALASNNVHLFQARHIDYLFIDESILSQSEFYNLFEMLSSYNAQLLQNLSSQHLSSLFDRFNRHSQFYNNKDEVLAHFNKIILNWFNCLPQHFNENSERLKRHFVKYPDDKLLEVLLGIHEDKIATVKRLAVDLLNEQFAFKDFYFARLVAKYPDIISQPEITSNNESLLDRYLNKILTRSVIEPDTLLGLYLVAQLHQRSGQFVQRLRSNSKYTPANDNSNDGLLHDRIEFNFRNNINNDLLNLRQRFTSLRNFEIPDIAQIDNIHIFEIDENIEANIVTHPNIFSDIISLENTPEIELERFTRRWQLVAAEYRNRPPLGFFSAIIGYAIIANAIDYKYDENILFPACATFIGSCITIISLALYFIVCQESVIHPQNINRLPVALKLLSDIILISIEALLGIALLNAISNNQYDDMYGDTVLCALTGALPLELTVLSLKEYGVTIQNPFLENLFETNQDNITLEDFENETPRCTLR